MVQCQKLHSNIHSFFPYQLAITTKPKLISMSNRKSALPATPSTKVISNNLKEIHKACEAFIASENSEIYYKTFEYITGDHVYFKRSHSKQRMAWTNKNIRGDQDFKSDMLMVGIFFEILVGVTKKVRFNILW